MILGIVSRFQEQGAVCNISRSGRPRTERIVENQLKIEGKPGRKFIRFNQNKIATNGSFAFLLT